MKTNIHPKYYPEAKVICSCGNTWNTGSTHEVLRTDVCSKCHPFFTGEQRIVDSAGQVDRFMKRLGRYSKHQNEMVERQEYTKQKLEKRFLKQQLVAIDLNEEAIQSLSEINIFTIGDLAKKIDHDSAGLLALRGFQSETIKDISAKIQDAQVAYFKAES